MPARSRPWHAGVAGVANVAGPQPIEPAVKQRGREAGGQVGRERDLAVQSRVAGRVDDLHDDVRADVNGVGTALSSGHGAGITAQGRYRDRASGIGACRR